MCQRNTTCSNDQAEDLGRKKFCISSLGCKLFAGQIRVSADASIYSCRESFNRCSHKTSQKKIIACCQNQCHSHSLRHKIDSTKVQFSHYWGQTIKKKCNVNTRQDARHNTFILGCYELLSWWFWHPPKIPWTAMTVKNVPFNTEKNIHKSTMKTTLRPGSIYDLQ